MPKQRRTSRSGKPGSSRNQETGPQKARKQGVTWGGDPSVDLQRKQSKNKSGRISTPTKDVRHTTKIRFGAFHPEEHFSKKALALIPVDGNY